MEYDDIDINATLQSNYVPFELSEDNDCVEVNADEREPESQDTATGKRKGKRKREKKFTSPVWSVFELLPDKSVDGVKQAKCKFCGEVKRYESQYGTGNLNRHMNTCVRRDTRDVGQMILTKTKDSMLMRSTKFNSEQFREKLIAAIVMHNLPLSFVEYSGIKELFSYLHDGVTSISRNTTKSDILNMHKRERNKLKHLLKEIPGRICLTSDLWTSITTDGYICLTAHFIDKQWKLQKRILNFSFMPPPHNGVSLSEKVYALVAEWGIDCKLFSITLDNASANDTFVDFLKLQLNVRKALLEDGKFFHLRCCAHILNLIVQDGLKEVGDSVKLVRESVKYVKGSQVRKQKFLECVNLVSLNPKRGLRQDVPTRWNSTYLMLQNALYFRMAFTHLEISDSNYKSCPSKDEWDKIEKLSQFLCVFYDITCVFSGTKYPTANLYFPSVFWARLTLDEHMKGHDVQLKNMAKLMFAKFEKYWSEFSLILAIAVILDPRYKLQFVDWSYKKLYGNDSYEFQRVKDTLFSLYDEYTDAAKTSKTSSCSSSSIVSDINNQIDDERFNSMATNLRKTDAWKEFDTFDNEYGDTIRKSQLEMYLEEPRAERTKELNVLQFWKHNQFRYHELAAMARDILSIPISTVASESAFSVGGKVLDQYRSSLKPDIVEAIICSKDWLFGELADDDIDAMINDVVNLDLNKEDSSASVQVNES